MLKYKYISKKYQQWQTLLQVWKRKLHTWTNWERRKWNINCGNIDNLGDKLNEDGVSFWKSPNREHKFINALSNHLIGSNSAWYETMTYYINWQKPYQANQRERKQQVHNMWCHKQTAKEYFCVNVLVNKVQWVLIPFFLFHEWNKKTETMCHCKCCIISIYLEKVIAPLE
jgi:hypothetical protein